MDELTQTAGTADDPLRDVCAALLRAAEGGADDPSPLAAGLRAALARALGEKARELAADLRRELPAWEDAGARLREIGRSSLLPVAAEAAGLSEGLDLACREGGRLAAALEAVADPSSPVPHPAPLPRPAAPPVPVPPPTAPPPDEPHISLEPPARPADETVTDAPAVVSPAIPFLEEAEACRRGDDADGAERLYGRAIEVDPTFRPAWVRRGLLALRRGHAEQAANDLAEATRLDDRDPLAWWWRGDALAVAGRLPEAVVDYSRALLLRPALHRARFNRAVAWRLLGEAGRALTEFDAVLRAMPDFAPAFYNRGLIHLASGAHTEALADFSAVLRLDPAHPDAARRREEAVRLLTGKSTPPPAPRPARPPVPPAARPATPPPAAAPRTESAPARQTRDRSVEVRCPACGQSGAVPWDRLGGVLECKACGGCFRITADGRHEAVVRDGAGRWLDRNRRPRSPWLSRRAALAGVAGVLLAAGGVVAWAGSRPSSAAAEPPLPAELQARAELFGVAWLRKDAALLRRLTTPALQRATWAWLQRTPPPELAVRPPDPLRPTPTTRPGAEPEAGAAAHAEITAGRNGTTVVRLSFSGLGLASDRPPPRLTLFWEERGKEWFFVPPQR